MKIRFADEKDIARINELLVQIGGLHHKARPDIFNPATPKFNTDDLKKIFDSTDRFILVAVDEFDVVQGHLFCQIRESDGQGVIAKIKTMWIDEYSYFTSLICIRNISFYFKQYCTQYLF